MVFVVVFVLICFVLKGLWNGDDLWALRAGDDLRIFFLWGWGGGETTLGMEMTRGSFFWVEEDSCLCC